MVTTQLTRCGQRAAIVWDGAGPPLDEGAKNVAVGIMRTMTSRVGKLLIAAKVPPWGVARSDAFVRIPNNRLLLGESFAAKLRSFAPDFLVYVPSSSFTNGALARAATLKRALGGVPVGVVCLQPRHRTVVSPGSWPGRRLRSLLPDVLFTQSAASRRFLTDKGWLALYLPGGVDLTKFSPAETGEKRTLRLKYGLSISKPTVIHVGHLCRARGISLVGQLAEHGYQVVVVGSTSTLQEPDVCEELRRKGVLIIGEYLPHIEEIYRLADCYVFPTTSPLSAIEIPLSVLEAMAANLPVVTTAFGGLPSLLAEGEGLVYMTEGDEITSLVQAAIKANPCGTRRKVEAFSWEGLADVIVGAMCRFATSTGLKAC